MAVLRNKIDPASCELRGHGQRGCSSMSFSSYPAGRDRLRCPECGGQKKADARRCRACWRQSIRDRALSNYVVDPETGCWIWNSLDRHGYGTVRFEGSLHLAHRLMYERTIGPVPEGLDLDHLCRNRACANPDHLEPVTRKENVARGLMVGLRTHCKNGHPWIEENKIATGDGRHERCRICHREDSARRRKRSKS
jgi:hypothetical protein